MDKLSLQERRKKTTKDVSLYNRFLWQRYSLAFLFFFNFNWIILTLGSSYFFVIPVVLLILCTRGLFEHIKIYGNHTNHLEKTKTIFKAQVISSIFMLMALLYERLFKFVFPFLKYQSDALILVGILSIAIVAMSLWNLHVINKIAKNKDSYFKKVITVMNKYS